MTGTQPMLMLALADTCGENSMEVSSDSTGPDLVSPVSNLVEIIDYDYRKKGQEVYVTL